MTIRTLGVEEEFLLLDPDTGAPRPAAPAVLRNGSPLLEKELTREQVEIGTPPALAAEELRAHLVRLRSAAGEAARTQGVLVAALPVSPVRASPTTTPDERYLAIRDEYALLGRDQLTCGCHVHVGVSSREEAVGALDRIRPWLAPLVAISANSPYYHGGDTGYASWRTQLWQRWPSAGPTGAFGSVEEYDRLADALVASGVILDKGMLYYDARLSHHLPTLEVRVADVCRTVDDAVLVALLVRALVTTGSREWASGAPAPEVRVEVLRMAAWRASKNGPLDGLLHPATWTPAPASSVLSNLVAYVREALEEADDLEYVQDGLARVLAGGGGAARQHAACSQDDMLTVVRDAAAATVSA